MELIEEAEGINSDMLDKLEDHTNSGSSGDYDNAKDVSEELNESTVGDNTESSLDDYVYDEELFTNLKDAVENAIQSLRVESGPRTDALITKLENDFRTLNVIKVALLGISIFQENITLTQQIKLKKL
ncbi:hypothetical protein SAMN05216389_11778 [Oceanobacillus limi]|uniref:Uncharacterized protein n=1 Tax=Oceanobacillus limi TaxID=930131 RepID=A0A1I0FW29_9BACI|nr:hypothetical protein [Oceanobacillus limi]SET62468.1 hypothetical protein SAMN05216389_11778 [Oceanobacillus limi]